MNRCEENRKNYPLSVTSYPEVSIRLTCAICEDMRAAFVTARLRLVEGAEVLSSLGKEGLQRYFECAVLATCCIALKYYFDIRDDGGQMKTIQVL